MQLPMLRETSKVMTHGYICWCPVAWERHTSTQPQGRLHPIITLVVDTTGKPSRVVSSILSPYIFVLIFSLSFSFGKVSTASDGMTN